MYNSHASSRVSGSFTWSITLITMACSCAFAGRGHTHPLGTQVDRCCLGVRVRSVIQEKQSVHVNWHSHVVIFRAMPDRRGGIRAHHAAKKGSSYVKSTN